MTLTREQFERESNYQLALQIMKMLRKKGLLTSREFRIANKRLAAKFDPVWGRYPDLTVDTDN